MKLIGLMSGTSVDGIDAALIELEGTPPDEVDFTVLGFLTTPWEPLKRRTLLETLRSGGPAELAELHLLVAEGFADAVVRLLDRCSVAADEIAAIGSHGQTVWHRPPTRAGAAAVAHGGHGARGISLQLGDPATLAARTAIGVVSDFRSADVAAGGHGAPLVPWVDRMLFAHPTEARVLLNIGGMANLTWVPPRGSTEIVRAFDTGPGNVWLDAAAGLASEGRQVADVDGQLAAAGTVHEPALAALLADPFFAEAPPRSTGREHFSQPRLEAWLTEWSGPLAEWPDRLATLTALTARSIAQALARWIVPLPIAEIVVTGGGARNPALLRALRTELDAVGLDEVGLETAKLSKEGLEAADLRTERRAAVGAQATDTAPDAAPNSAPNAGSGEPRMHDLGDAREAIAFAALAWAHLRGIPANVPACTGARGPRVLGSWTPAPPSP